MRISSTATLVGLLAWTSSAIAQTPSGTLDPLATDPIKLGWMVGSPPPADRMIRFRDGSSYRFPQWRWSFSHWRELVPTIKVSRGSTAVHELPRAERTDLDAVTFVPYKEVSSALSAACRPETIC